MSTKPDAERAKKLAATHAAWATYIAARDTLDLPEPSPVSVAAGALLAAALPLAAAMCAAADFPENDDAYAALVNAQIDSDKAAAAYAAALAAMEQEQS